jgi:alpha-L-fucosidase
VRKFDPIDVLWYDGWWPFNAEGWQAERMNEMVRKIQPHILFNGRNGLPGDFGTPEQHLSAPKPWRPFEACVTLNNSWGYHAGDHDWKSPWQVIEMLATVAQNRGNLLLNIGPRGDGSVPEETIKILDVVGAWLKRHGECIFDTDFFTFDLQTKGDHCGDWHHHGPITARGNNLYLLLRRYPGQAFAVGGIEANLLRATMLATGTPVKVESQDGRLVFSGLPADPPDPVCPVLKLEFDRPPTMYLSGGLRNPGVAHPHYDPCPSDIAH